MLFIVLGVSNLPFSVVGFVFDLFAVLELDLCILLLSCFIIFGYCFYRISKSLLIWSAGPGAIIIIFVIIHVASGSKIIRICALIG